MEDNTNKKGVEQEERVEEVIKLFNTSLVFIRQKIAELEKELKEEKDKEKIEKIKSRINSIQDL